jgi:8-hydroxy-5-deazaflavin:NADPH oxidoreductase
MASKKIGLLGSGTVAKILSTGFIKHGYEVMMGSRDTTKLNEWKSSANVKVRLGSVEDAVKFGDLIVLAVKGIAAETVVKNIAGLLQGKTVIDTTNPIAQSQPENVVLKYFTDLNESLMERLQKAAPFANFVKCFNSVGSPQMIDPKLQGGKPTMFICGNNDEARKEVTELLTVIGWETADMGKAVAARAIEPLCMLWCIPGFLKNEWNHAFKLLHA